MNSIEKRKLMMDNYLNPCNKCEVNDISYLVGDANNNSCIDEVKVMIKMENNVLKDIKFTGEACAICTSSASVMTKLLKNKTVNETKKIMDNFSKMINNEKYNQNILEEALIFDEIYKQPNRKICAMLPWKATEKIINTLDKDL